MARKKTPPRPGRQGPRAKNQTTKSGKRAVSAAATPARPVAARPGRSTPGPVRQRPWTAAEIEEAFRRFREANPEPKGELEHINPFTLLVAVVLSAQATDAGVNKATRALFPIADTPHKMAALGEERLRGYIKTVGLYPTKARNVIALSQRLVAEHGGDVPHDRAALEALPGVGRKTANVVLNTAFGEPTIAVDTHIFRVANRTGLGPGKTPIEVETKLEARVPETYKPHAHHWLILHGRYICKAIKPACDRCLINDLCQWPQKTA